LPVPSFGLCILLHLIMVLLGKAVIPEHEETPALSLVEDPAANGGIQQDREPDNSNVLPIVSF
jgi:hypothetical protein